MSSFIIRQLPIPSPGTFRQAPGWTTQPLADWLRPRVAELTYTAHDLRAFGEGLGFDGEPFVWVDERRSWLRAELDAALFHLYGIERDDVEYVMDTFPIVRRKDEAVFGEYRTKERILQIYDALADAVDGGYAYESVLYPPPGHGPRHPQRKESS